MQTILVTGANRGLGLEFCRQYAEAGDRVIAACRNPDSADQLQALAENYSTIQIEALDVADFAQIDALSVRLADEAIDVLINNAGVYGDKSGGGFGNLDYQAWSHTLLVNSQAPVKMSEAFLPQLQRSDKKLIVALSSQMGSIADNSSGGSILYRSSKAALNAAMKSVSIDLMDRGVGVLIFHPGWVRTDMGGPNGLIDADESVTGMRKMIDAFLLRQSGSFIKYEGSAMPW
ncbi:MAG: short-chain dehydrogenase [Gammaproteobacteria bacterium HGW-Gammaproteobacteria-10]|nr:MAG: short-chain dehydrogenase [Gammaproteobacteria bacterium HGW-Gammaproteobacteria-10]